MANVKIEKVPCTMVICFDSQIEGARDFAISMYKNSGERLSETHEQYGLCSITTPTVDPPQSDYDIPDYDKQHRIAGYLASKNICLTQWQAKIFYEITKKGRGAGVSFLIKTLSDLEHLDLL